MLEKQWCFGVVNVRHGGGIIAVKLADTNLQRDSYSDDSVHADFRVAKKLRSGRPYSNDIRSTEGRIRLRFNGAARVQQRKHRGN